MFRIPTRRVLAPALALAGAASALVAAPPAHAADGGQTDYVALGDSYAAGSGLLPASKFVGNPLCAQSAVNYPHLLTAAKGYALRDVTCGGATSGNFAGSQYGFVAPQLNALSTTTDLVTMTIGGNDSNVFFAAMIACGTVGRNADVSNPCQARYGDTFVNLINYNTYPALVRAFTLVKQKAPNARIAASGYPQILPASGPGCPTTMPVASGDLPYVDGISRALNGAIQRAAAQTGITYVDMYGISAGHDACKPVGTRWIEPLFWGTNPIPVHPNARGEQAYADAFARTLGL